MAEVFKVLGQSSPAATTLTTLYTVPAATTTTISTLTVANRTNGSIRFRISVAIAGAADAVAQYLYYDVKLADRATFTATLGITLAATDVVRVYTDTAGVTFQAFGVQVT